MEYEIDNYKVEIELLIHPIYKIKIMKGEEKVVSESMNIGKSKEEIIENFLRDAKVSKEEIMPIVESVIEKIKDEFEVKKDWW